MSTPYRQVSARNVDAPPTDAQARFIASLGGDTRALKHMNRAQASDYIGTLKGASPAPSGGPTVTTPPPVTPPPAPAPVTPPEPTSYSNIGHSFGLPGQVVKMLKKGRYAWQPEPTVPLVFLKVDIFESGKKKGVLDIKTQHGDTYYPALTLYPSGQMRVYRRDLTEIISGVISDMDGCAMTYARRKGVCSRCGKELTVERSRFYGIGPECEDRFPLIIEAVNLEFDGTYEELRASRRLPDWLGSAELED